jgi:hypothetical protein
MVASNSITNLDDDQPSFFRANNLLAPSPVAISVSPKAVPTAAAPRTPATTSFSPVVLLIPGVKTSLKLVSMPSMAWPTRAWRYRNHVSSCQKYWR